ncbi:hypothetical protein J4H65_20390 [Vibrio alginolyticus]|uniref:hypothetical protein n=2 Tax=Vibrionaceae TaxID=641 RepID=UPI001A1E12E6|nr:hypothetical protein [Vibrio alginolyticus]EGQ7649851.1 hypothetical protein [Vibrio alginolyticus]EGQ9113607.1 hypothetical protein [Vibrio alginolyticus]EHA1101198.1 hypothetical protein [Vibrio alginolyticus]EHA1123314.1 hypothetical protein [Vibrio alginolyticus]EJR0953207.1 hypothetical protein [Vibrio alginolyticus]
MKILEFIASIIDSLAWPMTILLCTLILREPMGKLLGRVSKFRYGEIEAEFQERLEKLGSFGQSEEIKGDAGTASASVALEDLAETSPRAAVLEAWLKVQKATSSFCTAKGFPRDVSHQGLFRLARERNLDIDAFQTAHQELRLLRNKAVHATDSDITTETALQYIKNANFLADEFNMRANGA